MPILYILEFLFCICVIIITINQVIAPMVNGLPVFPFFRKTRKLAGEITKVNEEIEDLKLEHQISVGKKFIKKQKEKS